MNTDSSEGQGEIVRRGPPVNDLASRTAFRERLLSAVENNPNVPPHRSGMQTWVLDEFHKRDEMLTLESVSKWFRGAGRPSTARGEMLAEILGVDAGWLLHGVNSAVTTRDVRARNALADGAVNLVAGLIQMDRGVIAFPEEGDKLAVRESIDLYAILRGVRYSIHVAVGEIEDSVIRFSLPRSDAVLPILVVRNGHFNFDLYEVRPEVAERHGRFVRGALEIEVPLDSDGLRPITSFVERL